MAGSETTALDIAKQRPIGWSFSDPSGVPVPPRLKIADVIVINHGTIQEEPKTSVFYGIWTVITRWVPHGAQQMALGALGKGAKEMPKEPHMRNAHDLNRSDGAKIARDIEAALRPATGARRPTREELMRKIQNFEEHQERLWSLRDAQDK